MTPYNGSHTVARTSRREVLKMSSAAAAVVAGISLANGRQTAAQTVNRGIGKTVFRPTANTRAENKEGCPSEIRAALSGPWPSIHTPFTRHGELDMDALHRQIDFVIQAKAKAVVLTAGDSLYSILTDDEIGRLTKAVVQYVNRRALVVAATDTWWTGKTVDFAKYCTTTGADVLMVLPPDWAASTTVDSLVAHYRAAAEHIPVMIVTNYLSRRSIGFGLELCRRLSREVPGVVALKDDWGGEFICKVCLATHDRWALSAGGQKRNHLLMVPYGVDGYLSTFINFRPDITWRYWKAIEAGDLRAAAEVVRDYDMPLFDYLVKSEGGFDAVIHGLYELFGLAKRFRRPPYYSLGDKQMEQLAEFLHQAKLL